MHAYSARVDAALRAAFPDGGPDLIEFCDYLAEGFVTVQARHTQDPWLARHAGRGAAAHHVGDLRGARRAPADDFATVAVHEAERYALRHADRVLWSGGDVLETYRRFYGAERLAPGERIPDAFLVEPGAGAPGGDARRRTTGRCGCSTSAAPSAARACRTCCAR